jgi:galactonate dehydratase
MPANIHLRRARLLPVLQAPAIVAGGSASDMEIREAVAWNLREPGSGRVYTILGIRTRSGITGYGECTALSRAEFEGARKLISGRPATAFEVTAPLLAEFPTARAALNIAMLDAVGKAARVPLYQLLGAPTRSKARALTALEGNSDAALVDSMKRAQEAGFRAFIVPVPETTNRNQGQAYLLATRKRLETLRKAGGDGTDFVLDGGNRLTPSDAQMISAGIERFHVLWFDEPCPPANAGAIKKIAAENVTPIGIGRHARDGSEIQDLLREDAVDVIRPDIGRNGISQIRRMAAIAETYYVAVAPTHYGGPIATGERLVASYGFRELTEMGVVDILQPDINHAGGITAIWKIGAVAAASGISMAPHNCEGPIGGLATIHVDAAMPNFVVQEVCSGVAPGPQEKVWEEWLGFPAMRMVNGRFPQSDKPGLGFELSEDALKKYPFGGTRPMARVFHTDGSVAEW